MSWKEVTIMSQRKEFVNMAITEDSNISELCRRFGISRKTGYKFINRYREEGLQGLADRSKRPRHCPNATDHSIEDLILALRRDHPAWGARKLKRRLEDIGHKRIPSPSTINGILKRHGCIDPQQSQKHKAWKRFRADMPNDLWQMDFKGYFNIRDGCCHPLTILDDHSRYSLGVKACTNQKEATVKSELIHIFRTYGLPYSMLVDNGAPWGSDADHVYTILTVWLMRMGIRIIHSRPYHPQTLGKDERFHRTLNNEVILYCSNKTIDQCKRYFEQWRHIYNTQRPHEALEMNVPATHYQMSQRNYPEKLPDVDYAKQDEVRKVQHGGFISFKNREFRVGKAFKGQLVAVRPTEKDGCYKVYFMNQSIAKINLSL